MKSDLADKFKKDKLRTRVFNPPEAISERFDVLEFLAENDHGETYLLAEKDTDKRFVLKCLNKTERAFETHEAEVLRELSHEGLPGFEAELELGGTLYMLREYAQGVPLNQYMESVGGRLGTASAISIATQLCDILAYLHSQPEPVIHRDVKPSNIIVDTENNSVKLIDFGIARRYSKDAASDTAYYGTKEFSPPEQYGYAQTDSRTDIYALGIVLRYMLTGSLDGKVGDKRLARVIGKCTAFSPGDRYRNAAALKKDLCGCGKGPWLYALRSSAAALAICAALPAGIYIAYSSGIFRGTGQEAEGAAVFAEPFIEAVVRHILEKDEDAPILPSELGTITRLALFEKNFLDTYYGGETAGFGFMQVENSDSFDYYGLLNSLDDFPLLYNLREVMIFGQPIRDISPIAQCSMLQRVEIFSSPVTDATPLAQIDRLQSITISDCAISDYSFLAGMEALRSLNIENMPLADISEITAYNIRHLSVLNTNISTLDGLERFSFLEIVNISYTNISDFSLLNSMATVKKLIIAKDMERYLHTLARDDIEIFSW